MRAGVLCCVVLCACVRACVCMSVRACVCTRVRVRVFVVKRRSCNKRNPLQQNRPPQRVATQCMCVNARACVCVRACTCVCV